MEVLVTVNQAVAVRLGVNAPSAAAWIDIDPEILSFDERDALAALIDGQGCDATGRGLRFDHAFLEPEEQMIAGTGEGATEPLVVDTPDVEGLIEGLGALVAEYHDRRSAFLRGWRERIAALSAEIERTIGAVDWGPGPAELCFDVEGHFLGANLSEEAANPALRMRVEDWPRGETEAPGCFVGWTDDEKARWREACEAVKAKRDAYISGFDARLMAEIERRGMGVSSVAAEREALLAEMDEAMLSYLDREDLEAEARDDVFRCAACLRRGLTFGRWDALREETVEPGDLEVGVREGSSAARSGETVQRGVLVNLRWPVWRESDAAGIEWVNAGDQRAVVVAWQEAGLSVQGIQLVG